MTRARTCKTLALGLMIIALAPQVAALPEGTCYTREEVLKKLAAEGQSVVTKTGDNKFFVTSDERRAGYILQSSRTGSLCVESTLGNVTTSGVSENEAIDICGNPQSFPQAVTACADIKAQTFRAVQAISATAPTSLLSPKTKQPVELTLYVCVYSAGRRALCGRTETLKTERLKR